MKRKEVGRLGEQLAARYLDSIGYRVLQRNFRCSLGEIDIIAQDIDTLVFVEVRTRTGDTYGTAVESLTFEKLDRLKRLALYYIQVECGYEVPCRIDLVAVEFKELHTGEHQIEHIHGIG